MAKTRPLRRRWLAFQRMALPRLAFIAAYGHAGGDPFLHDSLSGVGGDFMQQLLPVMQARFEHSGHPCDNEVSRLCPHAESALHCLGRSASRISPECAREVEHAVPYVCSSEFCDDLGQGILPCLEGKGAALGPACAEAIVAARHALSSLGASQQRAAGAMRAGTAPRRAVAVPGGGPGTATRPAVSGSARARRQ